MSERKHIVDEERGMRSSYRRDGEKIQEMPSHPACGSIVTSDNTDVSVHVISILIDVVTKRLDAYNVFRPLITSHASLSYSNSAAVV